MLAGRHLPDRDHSHDLLAMLVPDRHLCTDDTVFRVAAGTLGVDNLPDDVQAVPRPHRLAPAQLVNAHANHGRIAVSTALNEKAHGERGDLPAARNDRAEAALSSFLRIGMDRLRIILTCIADDLFLSEHDRLADPCFADLDILKIAGHSSLRECAFERLEPQPVAGPEAFDACCRRSSSSFNMSGSLSRARRCRFAYMLLPWASMATVAGP